MPESTSPNSPEVSRRTFIRVAALGSAVGLPLLMNACGGEAAPASQTASPSAASAAASKPAAASVSAGAAPASAVASVAGGSASAAAKPAALAGTVGGVKLPTYIPFPGPKPDIAGTADGVLDTYFSYPKTLAKSVATPPGKGGDLTVFTNVVTLMPPLDQNPVWQRVNKELNVNLKLNVVGTSADALQKIGAIVAGGDVPDVMFVGPTSGAAINNLPAFLNATMADLTPFLSGDAVKDFPNLANIPQFTWVPMVVAGKLYGLPTPRSRIGNSTFAHKELLDQAGITSIKSADDFKKSMQAVAKPSAGVYGIADQNSFQYTRNLAAEIFGAPNNWGLVNGKLVKDYETDEYKAGLAFLRDLWAAQLFHPNSLQFTNITIVDGFAGSKFLYHNYPESPDGANTYASSIKTNPNSHPVYMAPFSADGKAKPQHFLGTGTFGSAYIKKASPERVKEILGVLNWMSAPFGSQEKLLMGFGIDGTDFTFDTNGNPVAAAKGYSNAPLPFQFIAQGTPVAYSAVNSKEFGQMIHDAQVAEIAAGVADPTLGFYSPSDGTIGAALRQGIGDAIAGVVTGREPMTTWDQAVKDWAAKGGNKIRDEFTAAMAAVK